MIRNLKITSIKLKLFQAAQSDERDGAPALAPAASFVRGQSDDVISSESSSSADELSDSDDDDDVTAGDDFGFEEGEEDDVLTQLSTSSHYQ